ncbi:hypothetical protein BDN71DRAFT_1500819 [Pleurotus eryngii]|uniref:Uncharacterized protein n=1 Tax=Pleurotus eryngii TaxID=5323 RepID=A0A9P6AA14_PLEER|nr:hypothetical protein BDN71DRAFT_1500819 [Pleurotus eryngii]
MATLLSLPPLDVLRAPSLENAATKGSFSSSSSVRTGSSVSDAGSSPAPLTPLSDGDVPSMSLAVDWHPETCLYLPVPGALHAAVFGAIFDKHSRGSCLGLCLPLVSSSDEDSFSFVRESFETMGMTTGRWSREDLNGVPYYATAPSLNEDADSVSKATAPFFAEQVFSDHQQVFGLAGARSVISIPSTDNKRILYILESPTVVFPTLSRTRGFLPPALEARAQSLVLQRPTPSFPTKANIPNLEEWKKIWAAWDLVTLGMTPSSMLHQKPIDLRHKCLFYIGHIPTFLDMLLSKSIGGGASEPQYFWKIFERGIDPHVDDPDHCHNHSEVPEKDEDWPTIELIMSFRDAVRARLAKLYAELESGARALTRNIARTLVMTIEHEAWHIETLLYMLIQRAGTGTLPPPGFVTPPFARLSRQWDIIPPPSTPSVQLGPATINLGHEDSEGDDFTADGKVVEADESFLSQEWGWDNESPARTVEVGAFRAEWRPVSNSEFEAYWRGEGKDKVSMPKSWVLTEDGEAQVRTVYGPVAMEIAKHWPVMTAYDDLVRYARWKGGRLPTEPELRLFLDTYEVGHENGANVGFRNWHPVPATTGLEQYGGRGSNGGVWEWTSTLFDNHDGLVPTNLFTGYSTDFFDTKHHVVLGASYATVPRLASRRTVRNFWQHNYPYPWVGARVVYDL